MNNLSSSLLGTATLLLCGVLSGCGAATSEPNPAHEEMVFVDVKTGKTVLLAPTSEVPVVNPETGKRTLMPAMYCSDCGRWYPVPPAEQMNRAQGAGMCPKHKTAMSADGPLPPAR